jgi:hypothetical protein
LVYTGIHAFDTCGRLRVAVTQLGEFLPVLKGINSTLLMPSAIKLGVLDDSGLFDDSEVQIALKELQFPIIKLDPEMMLISAEQKAKVLTLYMILNFWTILNKYVVVILVLFTY